MKKVFLFLMILATFQLFGCSRSVMVKDGKPLIDTPSAEKNTPASTSAPKKNIALVLKTLTNPFFVDVERGARKAEYEFGVNLLIRTGAQETSIEQQIHIVDELINEKIDAIIIAPGHSTDLIPILKKAQDAGIIIVNIDNRLDPEVSKRMGLVNVPFISVNNEDGAYQAAKYISDKISTPTEVSILEGINGSYNSEARKKGALRAFQENKNIRVVAIETANWKIDEALSVSSELFRRYPDMGAIYCLNDMMALGTLEYTVKSGKTDVLVGGFDALKEAREAIQHGKMLVSVDQQGDLQGYMGVKAVVQILQGFPFSMETYIPVKVITAE